MKTRIAALAVAVLAIAARADAQCTGPGGASGCGTSFPGGVPTIVCAGSPTVGNAAFTVDAVIPCATSTPLLIVGTCLPVPIPITGPFGAGGFCGPSMAPCLRFIGSTIFAAIPGVWAGIGPSNFYFPIPIPNDPTIVGASVCIQETSVCTIAGLGQCVGASGGLTVTVL